MRRTALFLLFLLSFGLTARAGDSLVQFNRAGSYGLFINGIRGNLVQGGNSYSADYRYRNFNGYREHSSTWSHRASLVLDLAPSSTTTLGITGYYFSGEERRPGSLTKSEFDADPYKADPRAINRDEKRITRNGELGISYSAKFGRELNQQFVIRGAGRLEHYTRVTKEFKIINRPVLSLVAEYVNNTPLWSHGNAFTAGGSLFFQPERTEEYENFSGQQSDMLEQLKTEKSSFARFFLSDRFELARDLLFLELRGSYDHVTYQVAEETLPSRSDTKRFHAFTPEATLTWSAMKSLSVCMSYGLSFRSPTDKELESPNPAYLYNQDLEAQLSGTLRLWIKGDLAGKDTTLFVKKIRYKAEVYTGSIRDEIVPYEIYGDEYYRNATRTTRRGVNLEARLETRVHLSLTAAWSFGKFIYRDYTANSLEADSSGNIVSIYRDFAGNMEPNNPGNIFSLAVDYKTPLGRKADLFAGAGYRYGSGLWVDDANSEMTGSSHLVNALAGIDLHLGHFVLLASCGIDNILGQVYVGYANVNSADKRFYDAGAPRSFTGNLNIAYVF